MHPTKSVRNDCGNGCSIVHQKQPSGGQLGSHGLEPDEREIHMREGAFEVDDERHATIHWENRSPLSMGINQFSPSVELYLLYKCAKENVLCVDSGRLEMCKLMRAVIYIPRTKSWTKHTEYHLRHVAVPRLGISTDLHPALSPVVIPLALGASDVLARPPQPETRKALGNKKMKLQGIRKSMIQKHKIHSS
jgi:hypothetical protein